MRSSMAVDGYYAGSLSGYMMEISPLTFPQFRIGIDHFFVASNVARYRALSRAWEFGNTLL